MTELELRPRLCHIVQGPNGYGFHLHGEKSKSGQKVRKVEADSPAEHAGLKSGDRIIAVNGKNVEEESHQQVVARIKEKSGETELLVIDDTAYLYFASRKIPITVELLDTTKKFLATEESTNEDDAELRPRLCQLEQSASGYGFNLHSEKGKQGRYVRAVDEGSTSEAAGLRSGDRIIEINGVNMEFEKHGKVVEAIKASGDKVELLVVGEKADAHFKSCKVVPTSAHVTGPLPTIPAEDGDPTTDGPKAAEDEDPASRSETTETNESAPDQNGSDHTTSASGEQTADDNAAMLEMDLQTLKQRVRNSKKKAPTSNWNNRQAIFNNL